MLKQILDVLSKIWSYLNNIPFITAFTSTVLAGIFLAITSRKSRTQIRFEIINKQLGNHIRLLDEGYADRKLNMLKKIGKESEELGYDDLVFDIHIECANIYMYPEIEKLDCAINAANSAIEQSKFDGIPYITRGKAYSLKGEHDKAIDDFKKAAEHYLLNKEDAYLYCGIEHYFLNEYDKAIVSLNKAIHTNPKKTDAFFYRGNCFCDNGKYDSAIKDFKKALSLNPKDILILNNCGCVYAKLGEYENAINAFCKAYKINPQLPIIVKNRSIAYSEIGCFDHAINDCELALISYMNNIKSSEIRYAIPDKVADYQQFYKDDDLAKEHNAFISTVLFNRGNIYAKKRDYINALNDYEEAMKISPDDSHLLVRILNNRANIYCAQNDLAHAIAEYNNALEKEPNNPFLLNNRANIYYAMGDYSNAIADYKKAIEQNHHDGVAIINLFHLEKDVAQNTNGIAKRSTLTVKRNTLNTIVYNNNLIDIYKHNQIIEKTPKDYTAYVNRGGYYYILHIFDKAIDDYIYALFTLGLDYGTTDIENINEQLKKYNICHYTPKDVTLGNISDIYNFIGLTFRGMNNNDRALFNYNIAITIDKSNPIPYNNIGFLYQTIGDYETALEYFDKAITLKQDYAEALNNRGIANNKVGFRQKAEEDYKKAAEYNDKFADPHYNLGILYFEDKRFNDAIISFKRAIKINNKFTTAIYNLSVAYSQNGSFLLSDYYLKKAYKLDPDNPIFKN